MIKLIDRYIKALENSNFIHLYEFNKVFIDEGFSKEQQLLLLHKLKDVYEITLSIVWDEAVTFIKNNKTLSKEDIKEYLESLKVTYAKENN